MDVVKESSNAVPAPVLEAVKRTLVNVEDLNSNFNKFLSLSDPEVLAELPPLQRAQSLLLIAKAASTLFAVRLRCTGVHPDDHPIKGELERLNRYQDKLKRFIGTSKEPLRPRTKLNYQAATRFIEHSLPDLTPEQRQSMRDITRSERGRTEYSERNVQRKRKYVSPDTKSVRAAAQEFLEKAAREILGENEGGVKGPLGPVQVVDIDSDTDSDSQSDSDEEGGQNEPSDAVEVVDLDSD